MLSGLCLSDKSLRPRKRRQVSALQRVTATSGHTPPRWQHAVVGQRIMPVLSQPRSAFAFFPVARAQRTGWKHCPTTRLPFASARGIKSNLAGHRRCVILPALKKANPTPAPIAADACCAEGMTCPLSQCEAGTVVCIKQLIAQPHVIDRLREMGLGEQQHIRLVSRHPSLICQVCNARVALSQELAESILVEPLRKAS